MHFLQTTRSLLSSQLSNIGAERERVKVIEELILQAPTTKHRRKWISHNTHHIIMLCGVANCARRATRVELNPLFVSEHTYLIFDTSSSKVEAQLTMSVVVDM